MKIDLSSYDFVDFGCGRGKSLAHFAERFKADRGLGLDISPANVLEARKIGFDALVTDLTLDIEFLGQTRFVSVSHILEHLASEVEIRSVIYKAVIASRDFVYITQPWFDTDGYLLARGLKTYWSDWNGHLSLWSSWQFARVMRTHLLKRRLSRFAIFGQGPIESSEDQSILPLTGSHNATGYAVEQGPKPKMRLEGVFRNIVVIGSRHPEQDLSELLEPDLALIYDSDLTPIDR
jgi:SAM-dependent methyltransferase